MNNPRKIESLEDLAYLASYKNLLSSLYLFPSYRPKGKPEFYILSCFLSNLVTNGELIIQFMRNCFQCSFGKKTITNDKFRAKMIKDFYSSPETDHCIEYLPALWAFLASILDESITELEVHAAYPDTVPSTKAIETMAHYSPHLKNLKMNCEHLKENVSLELMRPIALSFSALKNLMQLTLIQLNKEHRSILQFLGNSCPRLTHLAIYGFSFVEEDIMALFLGEFSRNIPESEKQRMQSHRAQIHGWQVSPEYLTPFCFTLLHLELEKFKGQSQKEMLNYQVVWSDFNNSMIAFILRHLPLLQKICMSGSCGSAIRLLQQTSQIRVPFFVAGTVSQRENLGHSTETSTAKSGPRQVIDLGLTHPQPFTGSLSLQTVNYVNDRCKVTIQAVGSMCPQLEEVVFFGADNQPLPDFNSGITIDQLKPILINQWPKMKSITFLRVFPPNCTVILETLGAYLTHLTFESCTGINISTLLYCPSLESLEILGFNSRMVQMKTEQIPEAHATIPKGFLSNLKNLKSHICLGPMSRHLEEKASLFDMELNCSHINTNASEVKWNSITTLWPNVKKLRIRQCSGLTVTDIRLSVLQLYKLQELVLPAATLKPRSRGEVISSDALKLLAGNRSIKLEFENFSNDGSVPISRCNHQFLE